MKEKTTNEFSFVLKSTKHGVGVFAAHNIAKGTFLRLFAKETPTSKRHSRALPKKDIPKLFQEYCVDRGETMMCPEDFGAMPVGWYLNHSRTPNATHQNYNYYSAKDIVVGEEITIDYNILEEPKESRSPYYRT